MMLAGLDQLRYALSVMLGVPFSPRSLERLVRAARRSAPGKDRDSALVSAPLDAETRAVMQLRRFRQQVRLGRAETEFYARRFGQTGFDPEHLTLDVVTHLPLTTKTELRAQPDSFVRKGTRPYLRVTTTGTTGQPTVIYFSERELRVFFALSALPTLARGEIGPEDIVQLSTASRGMLGNVCLAGVCAHIGALTYQTGLLGPDQALSVLAEKHHIPGKKSQVSVLYTYPSYLGRLVDFGLRLGCRPADFGLRRIQIGGEIVTRGLKERAQALLGPVEFAEGYANTELWPFGGRCCRQGHLHFDPAHGLLELISPDTGLPARPGEVGSIVGTPFMPFRETTLLIRYDTEDMVRALPGPPECELRHLPACGPIQGKRALSVRTAHGWVFPRQVMEALESAECVPLPARFGFWPSGDGVAVEVVASSTGPDARRQVMQKLEEHQVTVAGLRLVDDPARLRRPYPLRGDLREDYFN